MFIWIVSSNITLQQLQQELIFQVIQHHSQREIAMYTVDKIHEGHMIRLSELMAERQCLKNNTFGHSSDMLAQLLKENEHEATLLNREVILWKEGIEKRCEEDEEKFCYASGASVGDYLKVTVLPIPSTGTVNKFEVHSNVWLKSTDKFEVLSEV